MPHWLVYHKFQEFNGFRPAMLFLLTLAGVSAKSAHGRFYFKDPLENPHRPQPGALQRWFLQFLHQSPVSPVYGQDGVEPLEPAESLPPIVGKLADIFTIQSVLMVLVCIPVLSLIPIYLIPKVGNHNDSGSTIDLYYPLCYVWPVPRPLRIDYPSDSLNIQFSIVNSPLKRDLR